MVRNSISPEHPPISTNQLQIVPDMAASPTQFGLQVTPNTPAALAVLEAMPDTRQMLSNPTSSEGWNLGWKAKQLGNEGYKAAEEGRPVRPVYFNAGEAALVLGGLAHNATKDLAPDLQVDTPELELRQETAHRAVTVHSFIEEQARQQGYRQLPGSTPEAHPTVHIFRDRQHTRD